MIHRLLLMVGFLSSFLPSTTNQLANYSPQVQSTFIDGYGTVLFADIVSFTTFSQTVTAPQLVIMLNAMFMKFDRLADKNQVRKYRRCLLYTSPSPRDRG